MMNASTDQALLLRYASHRDEAAFAEIVHRYASLVFSACHRVLHNAAWAEDVSQEAFLRLLKRPGEVAGSLPAWLHRVATNLAIDLMRSEGARRGREVASQAELDELRRAAMDDEAERRAWLEISPRIDAALLELPEGLRNMLVEHFLDGRPQRDIARDLGISPAGVCRQIQSALAQLRRVLSRGGTVVLAATLCEWLAHEVIEAAPATLSRELGKMALVSGSHPGLAGARAAGGALRAPAGVMSKRRVVFCVGVIVLYALLIAVSMWRSMSRTRYSPPEPSEMIRPAD